MATPIRAGKGFTMPSLTTILLVLGVVVAVNLILVAVVVGGKGDDDAPAIPTEIETLIPARNAQIRTQDDVGVDLADDYTATLYIDGTLIPEDQVVERVGLAVFLFRPGPGKEFEKLTEGPHRATVEYRPADPNRPEPTRSFTWQFTAN